MPERVFVAWGCEDERLAEKVCELLESEGLRPVTVGMRHEVPLASEVVARMDACDFAVVLARKKSGLMDNAEFDDDVMVEWGYLLARLGRDRVFAALLDTSRRELPGTLIESWAATVPVADRSVGEVASEVVSRFASRRTQAAPMSRMDILSRWPQVKGTLVAFAAGHARPDADVPRLLLFSAYSAFYFDDLEGCVDVCRRLQANPAALTPTLSAELAIVQAKMEVYASTRNLTRPLGRSDFSRIARQLETSYEDQIDDSELYRWASIVRRDALELSYCMVAQGLGADEGRDAYLEKAVRIGREVTTEIEGHPEPDGQPGNRLFSSLVLGLSHRNIAGAYQTLGEMARARRHFAASLRARGAVYSAYRLSASNAYLKGKLAQEYYLALLEWCDYEADPEERRNSLAQVREYLDDCRRQQSLLEMVRQAYDRALTHEAARDREE